jgi:hypothetical protein
MRTGMALDQASDRLEAGLYALAREGRAPGYVKHAAAAAIKGDAGLPDHAFADPAGRNYPIHTKAATWVSTRYFAEQGASLPRARRAGIARALAEAAAGWGIEVDCAKEAAATRPAPAEAAADACGAAGGHFRIASAAEAKVACAYLVRHRDAFAHPDRVALARFALAKAAAYGAELDAGDADALDRMAGYGVAPVAAALALLHDRAALCDYLGHAKLAAALRARRAAHAALEPGAAKAAACRHDLAQAVEAADRLAGLDRRYADGLARAEDVLFAGTERALAAAKAAGAADPPAAPGGLHLDQLAAALA